MSSKNTSSVFKFIAISWGEDYYYRFVNYLIASIFNDSAISFLKENSSKYHFYFYLDQTSIEKFQKIPLIQNNQKFLNINLIDIAKIAGGNDKYDIMTRQHGHFIGNYIDIGDIAVFLHPDFIVSDRFIENLSQYTQKNNIILNDIIRLDETLVGKEMHSISKDGQIAVSSLALSKWARPLLHKYTLVRMWDSSEATSWPVAFYFRDKKTDNLLVRSFGLHVLAIRFINKPKKFKYFDCDLLAENFDDLKKSIYIIPDNQNLCIFDVCDEKLKIGRSLNKRAMHLRAAYILSNKFQDREVREITLKHTIKWICDDKKTNWGRFQRKANRNISCVRFLYKLLNFKVLANCVAHYYKNSNWFVQPHKLEDSKTK